MFRNELIIGKTSLYHCTWAHAASAVDVLGIVAQDEHRWQLKRVRFSMQCCGNAKSVQAAPNKLCLCSDCHLVERCINATRCSKGLIKMILRHQSSTVYSISFLFISAFIEHVPSKDAVIDSDTLCNDGCMDAMGLFRK